jgi:hypothetical protein
MLPFTSQRSQKSHWAARGFVAVEQEFLAVQAEKNRSVSVVLQRWQTPPEVRSEPRRSTALPWTLAAIGVVSVGVGAYFGVRGWNDLDDLHGDPCATNKTCDEGKVAHARRELVVADVAVALGIVTLGAATWLLLTRPSTSPRAASMP